MTTIDVQTAISPAVLFRMYSQQAHQDMYGGAIYDVSTRQGVRSFEGGMYNMSTKKGCGVAVGGNQPNLEGTSGYVQIPLALDQSAAANPVPPLDWYPHQYVKSMDDARKERQKAEYAGFYEQFVRATLSNYK
jgi:hypothetical protein